jgi:hypothetical protein
MRHSLLILAAASVMMFISCSKEKEPTREDFVGNWIASESTIFMGQTLTRDYEFSISLDPGNASRIIMKDFGNIPGANVSATVNGKDFTTEKLSITINGLEGSFEGAGKIEGDKITYTVVFNSTGFNESYNGIATRK